MDKGMIRWAAGLSLLGMGPALMAQADAPAMPPASRAQALVVPVRVRVARCDREHPEQTVVTPTWLSAQRDAAARIFAAYGIELAFTVESFAPASCVLLDARQRDSIAPYVARTHEATVVVVARIRDLDVPTYDLRGVHWHYAGTEPRMSGRRWVFLTARAEPPVLAHELAHYFGLPHDPKGGNLMTPGPSSPDFLRKDRKPFAPTLTAEQAQALRAGVERFLLASRLDSADAAAHLSPDPDGG